MPAEGTRAHRCGTVLLRLGDAGEHHGDGQQQLSVQRAPVPSLPARRRRDAQRSGRHLPHAGGGRSGSRHGDASEAGGRPAAERARVRRGLGERGRLQQRHRDGVK